MVPLVGIPTAALWLIAVLLAFFNPGPIWGVSHHTYTGGFFVLALVLSVVLYFVARSAERKRTNTLNSFALPLVLLAVPMPSAWWLIPVLLVVFFWVVGLLILVDWVKSEAWARPLDECTDNQPVK